MRSLSRVLPLVAALAACGTSVDVRPHLDAVCLAGSVQVMPFAVDLPDLQAPPQNIPDAALLEIESDTWFLDGLPYQRDIHVLGALLEVAAERKRHAQLRGLPVDDDFTVLIAAPATMPAGRVLATLALAHDAGVRNIHVLAWSSQSVQLPAPPDPAFYATMEQELQGLEPEMRAIHLAKTFQDEVWLCPGAAETLRAVAVADAEHKCPLMAHGLAESLPSCPATSSARVVSLAQLMGKPWYERVPTHLALGLDPAAERPSGATWADVVASLSGATAVGLSRPSSELAPAPTDP